MDSAQGLDLDAFIEFSDLMGAARTELWIDAFLRQLEDLYLKPFAEMPDRETVFQDAHKTVGTAGIVGCVGLVQACLRLQDACQSGAEIAELYQAAQEAAQQADMALRSQTNRPATAVVPKNAFTAT
jgi:HPt (histidine-containing phosphotransfer) domain-containing protein